VKSILPVAAGRQESAVPVDGPQHLDVAQGQRPELGAGLQTPASQRARRFDGPARAVLAGGQAKNVAVGAEVKVAEDAHNRLRKRPTHGHGL
jgi:hypothetical protein